MTNLASGMFPDLLPVGGVQDQGGEHRVAFLGLAAWADRACNS